MRDIILVYLDLSTILLLRKLSFGEYEEPTEM